VIRKALLVGLAFAAAGCGGGATGFVGSLLNATYRVTNDSIGIGPVDVYVAVKIAGSPINIDLVPRTVEHLSETEQSDYIEVTPLDYEFVFTLAGTKDVVVRHTEKLNIARNYVVSLKNTAEGAPTVSVVSSSRKQ
jgi:hypothetical protein